MLIDKGEKIQLDVIVEKTRSKKVNIIGPDGKALKGDDGKNLKEVVEVYNGYLVLPSIFHKEGLTMCGSVINQRNKVLKTRCTVYDKYTSKFYLVKHSLAEVDHVLEKRSTVGFKVK